MQLQPLQGNDSHGVIDLSSVDKSHSISVAQHPHFDVFMLLDQPVNPACIPAVDAPTEENDLLVATTGPIVLFTNLDEVGWHAVRLFFGLPESNFLVFLYVIHHPCHYF